MRSQAQRVVDRFGGVRKLMDACPDLTEHKIRSWIRTGRVAQPWHLPLLLTARQVGVELDPHDFSAHLVEELAHAIAGQRTARPDVGHSPA